MTTAKTALSKKEKQAQFTMDIVQGVLHSYHTEVNLPIMEAVAEGLGILISRTVDTLVENGHITPEQREEIFREEAE